MGQVKREEGRGNEEGVEGTRKIKVKEEEEWGREYELNINKYINAFH